MNSVARRIVEVPWRRFVNQSDDDLLGVPTDGSRRNSRRREDSEPPATGRGQESSGSSHGRYRLPPPVRPGQLPARQG